MRLYLIRIKCLLRNKGNMFWAFIFPLCLGTFFYLGFGRLSMDSVLSNVKAYVASDFADSQMVTQMRKVTYGDDKPLFDVNTNYTKAELEEYLLAEKITGYIYVENNKINYRIYDNGLTQTITKSFLDQYIQVNNLIVEVTTTNPEKLDEVLAGLFNDETYTEEVVTGTNPKANKVVIYFYALIAMACMYASYWGNLLANDIQANYSPLAARVNITPTHKLKIIITYALAALTVHFIGNLGLIAYLKYILKVEFSNHLGLIVLSSFVGTISGIALGTFLSTIIKGSYGKKEGIMTIVSMVLSFLSGLMVVDIKYLVTKNFPIAGYINPANLLTESFYSLYYYDDIKRYFLNLGMLFGLSLLMIFGSYLSMRGTKYDSI